MSDKHTYLLTHEGKLMSVPTDELYHWKYIKREKVNGKWKYYYHDDKVDKTKRSYDTARAVKEAIEDEYKRASDKHTATLRALSKITRHDSYMDADSRTRASALVEAVIDEFHDSINKKLQAERDLGTTYESSVSNKARSYYKDSAYDKYATTKKKYEKAKRRYDNSVGHDVANFLNNSSDKIDKAKNWVDGLFGKKKKK